MSANLHQRAKALFTELSELSTHLQQERLGEISRQEPELADELRSLLDYHTMQSLVAPATAPKIRTRSTLSTHYDNRSHEWLTIPLRGLLIALPFFIAAWLLSIWTSRTIQERLSIIAGDQLTEALVLRCKTFDSWERAQIEAAVRWASHPEVLGAVQELVRTTRAFPADELPRELSKLDSARQLQESFQRLAGRPVKFSVWDRRMSTLADWNQEQTPEVLGTYVTSSGANILTRVLKGHPEMALPRRCTPDSEVPESDASLSALSIFIPVRDTAEQIIAAIRLSDYGLESQYNTLFQDWNTATDQEFYLVSREGAMLTASRFDINQLELAYQDDAHEMPWLRDPGADLVAGQSPKSLAVAWPDTVVARQVKAKSTGCHVEGYRNYVGRRVVGAWHWIPRHSIALVTEAEYASTFATATTFRWSLLGISSLFGLGLFAFLVATFRSRSTSRRLRDISEIGPYQIQEIIGEGGMGRVYLAEHALLCRQSAVKVLIKGDKDLSIVSRFEREVQLASQLTHPNTIAIYDFGRNKDGIFYYAMEYINGAHLGQLVEYTGSLPPGRCIYMLRQLCRALQEAHQAGVVHRDIKPQNIMICDRGGEPDFVKLFDYGLVKAFAPGVSHSTSQTEVVVGTPRFMAPERLNSPWLADPRVDVYSIGALAYFLLTGQLPPLVSSQAAGMASEQPGVETLDLPANIVEFGGLLSLCMAVEPAARPSSMHSLMREIDALAKIFPWSRDDSLNWWQEHEARLLHYVHTKRKSLNKKD